MKGTVYRLTLVSSSTLTVDPQLLSGKEKRALVLSASFGPQYLSTRFVLAGTPPLGMAAEKSATTVILPSVEHTTETWCFSMRHPNLRLYLLRVKTGQLLLMSSVEENGQVLTVALWTSDVSRSRTRISKVPENPFRVTSCKTQAASVMSTFNATAVAANKWFPLSPCTRSHG